jgi:hypothetical protein
VLDATVWLHLFAGCHLGRDTAAAIGRAGFTIARLDRFLFPWHPDPGLVSHRWPGHFMRPVAESSRKARSGVNAVAPADRPGACWPGG